MPIVAHSNLPTFERLKQEGVRILNSSFALHQDIRELHIGLLNMMPDAALVATERQFFRLIGESNPIAQFFVHPFTLDDLPRGKEAQQHIDAYYESFEQIKEQGLDALIITGANVVGAQLSEQPFWQPLTKVLDWAEENVTSTLCSCLATHVVLEYRYGQKRKPQKEKIWGIFPHKLSTKAHPLTKNINTHFDVPHSRWNCVSEEQFLQSGLTILAKSLNNEVHLASTADGIHTVFFQGHPEYDSVSLLKEYKREVFLYLQGKNANYPPFPENYFGKFEQALLNEFRFNAKNEKKIAQLKKCFPEKTLQQRLNNTWHDTADEVVSNWMGLIYQLTHGDRKKPLMDHLDPNDPLGLITERT